MGNAEGNINFKSILYVPKDVPQGYMDGMMEQSDTGLSLYVRKVLISDEFELLPRYLYFLSGVVDSDDLPLNVNRALQESKIIQVIKKKVVRKALEMLKNFQKESDVEAAATEDDSEDDDPADDSKDDTPPKTKTNKYNVWYENFAPQLKMGVIDDEPNRNKILKLL